MRSLSRVASLIAGLVSLGAACRQSTDQAATGIVDGFWEGACLAEGEAGSRRVQYLFQDAAAVERSESFFADADCQELSGLVRFRGTYKLLTTADELQYTIEMNLTSVTALPLTEALTSSWTTSGFCSRSDWQAGREADIGLVSGPLCPSFGFLPIDYRDLIRVDDRPALLVFASDISHGQTPPAEIDLDRVAGRYTAAGH